jgi:crotonobetainyl-CoA:carnitine CoA-transferase CaiB-like acyl-CoA transferase
VLVNADVIDTPLNMPLSVLDDSHVMADGRTLPVQVAKVAGRLPALPYEGDGSECSVRRSAPEQADEHTSEVLHELRYTDDGVEAPACKAVVSGPALPVE